MLLNGLDWLILALYFAIVLAVGLYYTRRAGSSTDEFFVSGRNMSWWLLGISLVATTFAADTPNLVTDMVRTEGVSGNWRWWAFLLTGMCTVFFFAALWRRSGAMTDIGFYEMRYSGKPAAFLRGFRALYLGVFFNVLIMANVTLAAIKISSILLGFGKYTSVFLCIGITALYSCTAGLWGVIVTDVIMFVWAMGAAILAAYFAVQHPQVGGLSNLLQHEAVRSHLNFWPDFTAPNIMTVFIIPIAVQWWATWYPGAEPGGGGYVAQRMLAAKNEKHSLLSTLFFNAMHYAVRPWPWIIVALCSMIVFPDLESLRKAFPQLERSGIPIKDDLGYPAMLTFLPHGMLGLIIASLAAAYMSTIATHLNWGASYIVEDFYKRFVKTDAADRHYVQAGRVVTVLLMVGACVFSFFLQNALQAFEILLQIGAGTGLIYILRWFWWRINAWTEVVAMIVSFLVAIYFRFVHTSLGFAPLEAWQELLSGVAITTVFWLAATYLTPPTDPQVLQAFYDRIRPMGPGWARFRRPGDEVGQKATFTAALLCSLLGCAAIYSAIFATGYLLYGMYLSAVVFAIVSVASALGILKLFPRVGWSS